MAPYVSSTIGQTFAGSCTLSEYFPSSLLITTSDVKLLTFPKTVLVIARKSVFTWKTEHLTRHPATVYITKYWVPVIIEYECAVTVVYQKNDWRKANETGDAENAGMENAGGDYNNCWTWKPIVFSGRELAFTFAICYRRSVCRLSVCLSVCDVGAPYSGGWTFR